MSRMIQRKQENQKLREGLESHPIFSKNKDEIDTMIDGMDATQTKRLLKFLTKAVLSLVRDD